MPKGKAGYGNLRRESTGALPSVEMRTVTSDTGVEDDIIDPEEAAGPVADAKNGKKSLWPAIVESVGSLAGACTTAAFLPQVWAVHLTGDTSGLSLPMYCIFVFGVFMWMLYGVLKGAGSLVLANLITFVLAGYILAAIVENVFFHSQKEPLLEEALRDAGDAAAALLPMVAVCAAGPAHTFTHPRVHDGLQELLLQPGWDFFGAFDVRASYSPLEDAKRQATLVAPSRMQAALSSLAAVDSLVYDESAPRLPQGECPLLDAAPAGVAATVASLAYGVQQCHEMVLRAERRRNVSYTHIVRVRPDHLWRSPLPPPRQWSADHVLHPAGSIGAEAFAIVPRAAAAYLKLHDLLQAGCLSLSHAAAAAAWQQQQGGGGRSVIGSSSASSSSSSSSNSSSSSACTSIGAACLFEVAFAVGTHEHYADGAPVSAPRVGVLCGTGGLPGEKIDAGSALSPDMSAECL